MTPDDLQAAIDMANEPAPWAPRLTLKVKRLHERAIVPTRATSGSGGWDLYSCTEEFTLNPGTAAWVHTGIAIEVPPGYVGLVRGRSGLFADGVHVFDGTIDSDYRGEVKVAVRKPFNVLSAFTIKPGDRIAQLVIVPVPEIEIVEVDELSATERGEGGFGSSGR